MEVWTAWLIFAGGCFILEILTEGFLVCWLGVGGLCAMGLSFLFPEAYFAQVLTLAIVSIILILSTRKLTSKLYKKEEKQNLETKIKEVNLLRKNLGV